ncbi:PREDICTED: upstream-binding factor 1-like protein 1 [Capra hircus]|uniref:upstream-binding factor 1-like protein 1 n=1 Tax=Capra hircus TaxID=9925 RepID=UPI0008473FEC|nr:PREDICTED: upstream-binding factor 1-like protein 1 [Capra hircus]
MEDRTQCRTSEITHLQNLESEEAEDSAEVSEFLGSQKCPRDLEMAMPKHQEDWSKEDIVQLLESMEKSIPSSDGHTFKTAQSVMDWGKVAFKDFSGEMCKLKWLEVSHKLRKFRTLRELVLEAKENASNPSKKHKKTQKTQKKHQKQAYLFKKSLTAYRHISQVMRPQYIQKHPKISNQELSRVLSEEHRKEPEQLRVKHSQDLEKQHPGLVQNPEKSGVPQRSEMKVSENFQENVQKVKSPQENNLPMKWKFHGEPKKPPMNGYHKFHQDLWSNRELKVVSPRERMVEISRRWQRVPQDQKELYKKQAEELQTQYKVDLDLWLRTLSPEEYAAYREATCAKRKNMSMMRGPNPKIRRMGLQSPSSGNLQGRLREDPGLQAAELASSDTTGEHSPVSGRSEENEKEEEEGSSAPSTEDEDGDSEQGDTSSSSSSSGDSSDSDSD